MTNSETFAIAIRLTRQSIQESNDLKTRAKNTLSQSASIIDRSRNLLLENAAIVAPALFDLNPGASTARKPAPAAHPNTVSIRHEPLLERVVERDFAGETVILDGRHFIDCNLETCTLEYCGGPFVLEGTHFNGCGFRFGAEAAMTVSMLECFNLMAHPHTEPGPSPRSALGNRLIH